MLLLGGDLNSGVSPVGLGNEEVKFTFFLVLPHQHGKELKVSEIQKKINVYF